MASRQQLEQALNADDNNVREQMCSYFVANDLKYQQSVDPATGAAQVLSPYESRSLFFQDFQDPAMRTKMVDMYLPDFNPTAQPNTPQPRNTSQNQVSENYRVGVRRGTLLTGTGLAALLLSSTVIGEEGARNLGQVVGGVLTLGGLGGLFVNYFKNR